MSTYVTFTANKSTRLALHGIGRLCLVLAALWLPVKVVHAQKPDAGTNAATVQLNFPAQVELKVLVDYVSRRLGVRILYDEQINNKKVTVKAPSEIPVQSLMGVLQSTLKMKGFALVDAAAPGWKRIVASTDLAATARSAGAMEELKGLEAVTRTFSLKFIDPQNVSTVIKPFLTKPGGNTITIKEPPMLIVTDFATNVLKVAKLVELLDRQKPDVVTQFYPVRYADIAKLAQHVTTALSAQAKAEGRPASATVQVSQDARTNQLLLIGGRSQVQAASELIRSLDVSLNLTTQVYTFRTVSSERINQLIKGMLGTDEVNRKYRGVVDREANILIATATRSVHDQIRRLRDQLDVASAESRSPLRLYKLKNATVEEVLKSIRAIRGNAERQSSASDGVANTSGVDLRAGRFVPGPNRPPGPLESAAPTPPAVRNTEQQTTQSPQTDGLGLLLGAARVSADPNTNTLIVVAEPKVQAVFAELVKNLDRRRAQVLIEAKVVVVDTSDDFSLGVEVSTGGGSEDTRAFAFSSFGLSEVDPTNGSLAIIPGLGFNGTVIDAQTADVVVRALTRHTRSKVVSAPRILVNDNATGTLSSVSEVPFTSVNASQTVATTSFAGFAEAGTTIVATPHIGEGDHLQLDFNVALNSFTAPAGDGVPPPRQTDQIESKVTIPDGHTIIVGGLNRTIRTKTVDSFPFVENIPLIKQLARSTTKNSTRTSLFVFIKPVILREDKFRGLKYLSHRDLQNADEPGRFPFSEPTSIK